MKFEWLDDWVEQGLLTKEAADRVNGRANEFLKTAAGEDAAMVLAKKIAPWVTGALGLGGFAIYDKIQDHRDKKKILENQAKIMTMFEQQKDQDKAKARFEELARVSPAAASNMNLARNIVSTRLHSGLSPGDHQRLAILENHARKNRSYKGQGYIPKTGSDNTMEVRPEALGEMLGDSYILMKTAALGGGGFKLPQSIKDWAVAFGLMTSVPIAVSAVGGAARAVSDHMDKKKLEQELENAFQTAMERSHPEKEPLRDNPEKARQAFQALAHFSPRVATQPDAARSFMSKIVAYDQGINAGDVRDLTEIEKNLANAAKEHPFVAGFKNTAKGIGLSQLSQKGFETPGSVYQEAVRDKMRSDIAFAKNVEVANQL